MFTCAYLVFMFILLPYASNSVLALSRNSMPIRSWTDLTLAVPLPIDYSAKVATITEGTTLRYVYLQSRPLLIANKSSSQDLSLLGRPIEDTIIIDNSPASYIFHPNNAVPVSSWFNDPHDTELNDLCPFLADLGQCGHDVRGILNPAA